MDEKSSKPTGRASELWSHLDLQSDLVSGRCSSRVGPRPLLFMCIRTLAANIGSASEATIEASEIRREVLLGLWAKLNYGLTNGCRRGFSLHAWKILSKILLKDAQERRRAGEAVRFDIQKYRFEQTIFNPTHDLQVYTAPITSSADDFLASLIIDQVSSFQSDQLLALARMGNLSYLAIRDDTASSTLIQLSDHLIRGWCESSDPFPSLRALRLDNAHGVTERSLQYVTRLPRLYVYDVRGRIGDIEEIANRYGWVYQVSKHRHVSKDAFIYLALLLGKWDTETKARIKSGFLGCWDGRVFDSSPVTFPTAAEAQACRTEQEIAETMQRVWETWTIRSTAPIDNDLSEMKDGEEGHGCRLAKDMQHDRDDDERLRFFCPCLVGQTCDRAHRGTSALARPEGIVARPSRIDPGNAYDWPRTTYEDRDRGRDGNLNDLYVTGFWTCALTEMMERGLDSARTTFGIQGESFTLPLPSRRFVTLRLEGEMGWLAAPPSYPRFIFYRHPPKTQEDETPPGETPPQKGAAKQIGRKRTVIPGAKAARPEKMRKASDILGDFQ